MENWEKDFHGLEPCLEKFKPGEANKIKMACEACGFKFQIKKIAGGQLELYTPAGRDLTDFWEEFGI